MTETHPEQPVKGPETGERFDPDAGPRGDRPYPDSGRPHGEQDDLDQPDQPQQQPQTEQQ